MPDIDKFDEPAFEPGVTGLRHIFANAEFNEISGVLTVAGEPVAIEPRPLRLLSELLRRVNEVVTKDELFETVWAGRATVDHVLANAVSKLRVALGEDAGGRIVTLPRVGYRLNGPVRRVAADAVRHDLAAGQPVPGREGFVLERPLGPPGRSQVWLARHAKLGQAHVFKFADDASGLSAIKREYTLYRLLQAELGAREDFARVLDTQFLASPYYLECEYGGVNLLEWADEGGRLSALPLQERLNVFLPIARAVAAAHSVGVIHKDLKPANVLMAPLQASGDPARWQMRLTDFGSGRLLDPARLEGLQLTAVGMTQADSVTAGSDGGTLMYLAPELLAGHSATVQSDVYALGMLLYQMVAGDLRRPLASGWEREIDDALLREDIRAATDGRPHDRLKSADGLLERLSSLEARRAAREASEVAARAAVETAAQLQRVRARRPWLAAAVASLVVGLGVSVWFALQARSALELAKGESARAEAINAFLTEDFLGEVSAAAVGPDATVSMRLVLERASQHASKRFSSQPLTEALVRGQLAASYYRLSLFQKSEGESRRALALAETTALKRDPKMLMLRFELARNLSSHDKLKEATEMLDEAERDAGTLIADESALALMAASARTAALISAGKAQEALPLAQRAVALADLQPEEDSIRTRFKARAVLGDLLYRLGQFEAAQGVLDSILSSVSERVGAVDVARARVLRARVRVARGKMEQAEPELIAARDELVARVGRGEQYAGVATAELANIYEVRGDFPKAQAAFAEVYANYERAFGKEHTTTQVMGLNLAIIDLNLGQAAPALHRLDAGRAWFVTYMGGEQGPVVQAVDFERARALTALAQPAEALTILARLKPERIAEAAPARDWADRLQAERGRALIASGRRTEGLALLQAALPKMEANGSSAWVLAGYRRVVKEQAVATAR